MATDNNGMRRMLQRMSSANTRDAAITEVHGAPQSSAMQQPAGESWPATSVQEQLWLLNSLREVGCAYNVPFVLEVHGPADASRTADAVWAVLDRHDGLNTTLQRDPESKQVMQHRRAEPLRPSDFRVESVPRTEAEQIAQQQARQSFDLANGPLLDVRVLSIDAENHWILLVAHHAIVDGWSIGVIASEIGAVLAGEELPPAPSWAQYALVDRDQSEAVQYWREQIISTHGAATGLQPDHETNRPTMQAGTIRFRFPDAGISTEEAAQQWGVSAFALQYAAFQKAIGRLSDVSTVISGVPLINRTRSADAQLVGPLSNTLPIALDVSQAPDQIIQSADAAIKAALSAQGAPVSAILKELPGLDRSSGNPLFQQLFNVGNLPGVETAIHAAGLQIVPRGLPNNTARTGLELTLDDGDGYTQGRVEYDLSLYTPETGQQVVESFQTELRALCQEAAEHGFPAQA